MNDPTRLAARYRKWLACYPQSFRREHDAELLAVLIATSRDGQRHPSPGEVAALVRAGLGMRLRPDLPRSARARRAAVRLLCLGSLLEILTWFAVIATRGSVAAKLGAPTGIVGLLTPDLVAAPLVAAALVLLAWAIGHRRAWADGGLVALTLLTTIGYLSAFSEGAATYAPLDLTVGGLSWLATVAAAILALHSASTARARSTAG